MFNERLLSVDPSLTCSGIAFFDGLTLKGCCRIKSSPGQEMRLQKIGYAFGELLEKMKPTILSLETQYVGGPNTNSIVKVIEVRGIFIGMFISYCTKYTITPKIFDIHPMQAKQAIGVPKGRFKRAESKKKVMECVLKKYPSLNIPTINSKKLSQDAADAIAIGVATLGMISAKEQANKLKV